MEGPMFKWSDRYGWGFGENCVDAVGPNDADTGLFEGHPYKGLAKEILQNSLDAKDPSLPDTKPVEVEFRYIQVPVNEIPGFDRINEVIGKCAEFYNTGDDGSKVQRWKRQSTYYLEHGVVPVLKISDFSTTGLSGVTELKGTNWSGLVREKGATNKSEGKGGSHGVGKFAPYSFSALRTILYSTKNTEGETAFQGKSILTSFKENDRIFNNVGVYGQKDSSTCSPIYAMEDVPEVFRRSKNGTDVIIVGFEYDSDWKEQIAVSVLQYCFFAFYQGRLVVRIIDGPQTIEISKASLSENMSEYEKWYGKNGTDEFQFTAPKYLKILTNPKMKHFEEILKNKNKNMGNVELYLVVDPELDGRSVYEMRSAGMGIQEDTKWRGLTSHFNGIFIATGKDATDRKPENNIDSFLRKCEDPAHNEWTSSFYKDNQEEAKTIIREIHQWIRKKIDGEIPKYEGMSHDAFGLNKYIQNTHNVSDNTEEDAFRNYEPLELEVTEKEVSKKVPTQVRSNGKGKGKGEKDEEKTKKHREGGGNPHPNNKQGKVLPVDIGRVWTPYNAGKYHVYFKPDKNYKQLRLRLTVSGDEQNNDVATIQSAYINEKEVKTYFGNIDVGDVRKGEPVDITLVLEDSERSGLEVQAYAQR